MLRPPLSWVGGKSLLRKVIVPLIPEHDCYLELFSGAAWVLFGKPEKWSRNEVLNDINDELVNFYEVMRKDRARFTREFRYRLVARTTFASLLRMDPKRLQPHERAARFYYLIKASYGATGKTFGTSKLRTSRLNLAGIAAIAEGAWHRLKRVAVENLDFEKCIQVYDAPRTFIYADPPYIQSWDYGFRFEDEEHERLARALRRARCRWMVSINDKPLARKPYRGFRIMEVPISYKFGAARRDANFYHELIVTNYRPAPRPL